MSVAHNPVKYWTDYYKKHDESPGQLLETLVLLRNDKKFDDIEAALSSYLTFRSSKSEPWMYEMFALAVERRNGPPGVVRTMLGYAAVKAFQSKNPNHLLSVADLLLRRGIVEKIGTPAVQTSLGEMIDLVAKQVPHRVEPLLMSLDLASRTGDPKRMGDVVESLLALGWPGMDEQVRRECRQRVETLAKTLGDEGKADEAKALAARLGNSLSRDLYIRLSWDGKDDLDLVVDEPLGATAQLFKMPRTVFGGAIVTNGFGTHPEEVYVCPRGFDGPYTVRLDRIFQPEPPAKKATLEVITHEGLPDEKRETHLIDVANPAPVVVRLEGGRRKDLLPLTPSPTDRPDTTEIKVDPKAKPATSR